MICLVDNLMGFGYTWFVGQDTQQELANYSEVHCETIIAYSLWALSPIHVALAGLGRLAVNAWVGLRALKDMAMNAKLLVSYWPGLSMAMKMRIFFKIAWEVADHKLIYFIREVMGVFYG